MNERFLEIIEKSIKVNWDLPALTDHKSSTFYYKDMATEIAKLHIVFEQANIKKGDKIALMGRNSSKWGISFFAVVSYGAVAVPILNDFKPENVHHIVNHSETKLFLLGDSNWENLNKSEMPEIGCFISLDDFSVLHSQNPLTSEKLNARFVELYPDGFTPEHVKYHVEEPEELALINYTSGTSGFSKGVMLPYRSIWSNTRYAIDNIPFVKRADNFVSMLPMAHMYGLAFDLFLGISKGCHLHFLPRVPNPKSVIETYGAARPTLVIAVPLVLEKIIKNRVLPKLNTPAMKILRKTPLVKNLINKKVLKGLNGVFGGNFVEVVLGGAPLSKDIEDFLQEIGFAYTVGYGMTECGPLLSYEQWDTFRPGSVGKAVDRVQLKIDSADPENVTGEILVSGTNNMLGYYKNPEATAEVMLPDGWMRTGDLGVIDKDGHIFIRGRSKALILSASGQNIYPEEIESVLSNLPYVADSLIIQKGEKLVGLVYPNLELAEQEGLSEQTIESIMKDNLVALNQKMPNYSKISDIVVRKEPFEKTPKQSIKRYLYQEEG